VLCCVGAIAVLLFAPVKTAANFRALNDLLQNALVLALALLVFAPSARTVWRAAKLGVFVMVFDFVLETAAVRLDWWHPLGGTQFPPVIVVPVEMLTGFLLMGTSLGVVLSFPEALRDMRGRGLNWIRPWFLEPKRDLAWQLALLALLAVVGTHGDYAAGPAIWAPGPQWHPFYTFCVWTGSGLAVLWVYYLLGGWAEQRAAR